MKNILARFTVAASLAVLTSACATFGSQHIADLQRHPARYQDHTVTVNGVVTSSWGLPLVPFRFYKVDDGTGEVTVVAQDGRLPAKGAHVRVDGRVGDVASLGGQSVGLHIQQTGVHFKAR